VPRSIGTPPGRQLIMSFSMGLNHEQRDINFPILLKSMKNPDQYNYKIKNRDICHKKANSTILYSLFWFCTTSKISLLKAIEYKRNG
jgi:hypothetical protein